MASAPKARKKEAVSGIAWWKRLHVWMHSPWRFRFVRCWTCGRAHAWPGYVYVYERERMGQSLHPCGHGTYRELRRRALDRLAERLAERHLKQLQQDFIAQFYRRSKSQKRD